MTKKILFVGVLVWLLVAAAGPNVVSAEVDSLASPTPRPTEWITAPVISGMNPDAILSEGNQGETLPSGSLVPGSISLPVSMDSPAYVELESPSISQESSLEILAGDIENVNCGPAALVLAMELLNPDGKNSRPNNNIMSDFMSSRGIIYDWGTGVEELAYTAREFGYEGSFSFHGWRLEQLVEILKQGKPVVVPLGTNGENRPGHFVVLSNISEDGKWITCQDPRKGEIILSREEFLPLWKMQGSAGMIPKIESSSLSADPMVPWMGIFGAISALALTLNQSAGWKESRVFAGLRKQLDNPRRKGIGAGPLPPIKPDPALPPRFETITVFRGFETVEEEVPDYQTRKVKVGIQDVTKRIPQYETRRVQVGVKTISQRVPIYKTKRVRTGTRLAKREIPITRYKTIKKMVWKKFTSRVPDYRYIGSKRFVIGYKDETRWRRVQVAQKVPYQVSKPIHVQVPVYENKKVISGYRVADVTVPKFERKQILAGYKTINETVPIFEERQVQIGTKTVQRQMPVYDTVRVPIIDEKGDDEFPSHDQKLNTAEQKIKSICEDDKLSGLVEEREFEVTNIVYLKGGPGAGFGMEKVENCWSGFYGGGGGGSTPGMLLLKLASRALVWVRDATNILERLGAKSDAQAIVMFSANGDNKTIDEIVVINKGNETILVNSINLRSVDESPTQEKNIIEIYPKSFVGSDHQDEISIESGSFRTISVNPQCPVFPNTRNTVYIKLSTNSKRSGFLIYELQNHE